MNASLNEKLRTVKWGEYRIDDLFTKLELKYKKSSFDKENDISKVKSAEFDLPLVNAKDGDNGVMYYGRTSDFDSAEMTIDIVNDGAVSTGNVYPQIQKTGVLYNAYLIKPKFQATPNNLFFFATAIQKSIKTRYGYEHKASWDRVKLDNIILPTSNGKIDFDFIESFIAELEAERVTELSAYLTASGLNNCKLTDNEADSLCKFPYIQWKEYRMGELFDKIETHKLPYQAKELPASPIDQYILPCLTSSFQNQGLNYYAPKSGATILKNVISIPSNSDVYRAYFQSRDFTVLSDAYAIRWKNSDMDLSPKQYLFMVGCINKVTDRPIYSHKNKLGGWNVVKNKYIQLPQVNGKIDLDYMETLISAILKLSIKNVVLFVKKPQINCGIKIGR